MRFIRREALVGAVGALMAVVLLGAGTLILRNDGIEYPDGSIQRTADAVFVDSLGEVVGPVIGFSSDFDTGGSPPVPTVAPVILFRGDGYPMVFISRNGLQVPANLFCNEGCDAANIGWVRKVYFSLLDCTGSAYMRRSGNGFDNLVDVQYALGPDNKLYRSSTFLSNAPYQSVGSPGFCTNVSDNVSSAINMEYTGLDLDDLFTPPFHIE